MAGDLKPAGVTLEAKYKIWGYVLYDSAEALFNGSYTNPPSPPFAGTSPSKRNMAFWYEVGHYLDIEFYSAVKIHDAGSSAGYAAVLSVFNNTDGVKGSLVTDLIANKKSETPNWTMIGTLPKGRYRIQLKNAGYRTSQEWFLEAENKYKSLVLSGGEYKSFVEGVPEKVVNPANIALNKTYESSSVYTGRDAKFAFDDKSETSWLASTFLGWVLVDLGEPKKVKKVTLIQEASFRCDNFNIEYSDNKTSWTVALSSTLQKVLTPQDFLIDATDHKYWRLNITTNSSGGACGVAEFKLFDAVEPTIIPGIPAGWETVSTYLPTQIQFDEKGISELSKLNRVQGNTELDKLGESFTVLRMDMETGEIKKKNFYAPVDTIDIDYDAIQVKALVVNSNNAYTFDGAGWKNIGAIPVDPVERVTFYEVNGMDGITPHQAQLLKTQIPDGKGRIGVLEV